MFMAMALLLINLDIRDQIKRLLKEKAKTPRPFTVGDALKQIRSSVNRMLKRGFDYSDVVTALSEYNVSVSVEIIEAFYAPTKEKGKRKSNRKPEKAPELEQSLPKEQLEEIVARFRELSKSRKGLNLQELVADLEKEIDEDLAAGWDYSHITKWLGEDFGITIAPGTLKRYHTAQKRKGEQTEDVGSRESSAAPHRLQEDATAKGQEDAERQHSLARESVPQTVGSGRYSVSGNQQQQMPTSPRQNSSRGKPTPVAKSTKRLPEEKAAELSEFNL